MRLTNNAGLPEPIVRAVEWTDRDIGKSDYTVTQLTKPPRLLALERQHEQDLTEDASDRIWALMGSAAHEVLRRAVPEGQIAERRFYATVDEKVVSGQIDYSPATGAIYDYKFTSVWAVKEGPKDEWIYQLNCYRWLLAVNGVPVADSLQIVALLRDWSKNEARRSADYPQQGVALLPVWLWTIEETEAWVRQRIAAHEAAKANLPLCSEDDVWAKPNTWAVRKKGNVRATKVFLSEAQAIDFASTGKQFEIEYRAGERPRCQSYCACAPFCSQYQEWQQQRSQP